MVEPAHINFLMKSHLPSIGCFLSVLQFYGTQKSVKQLLKTLTKRHGTPFYLKHVRESTEFRGTNLIPRTLPMLVTLDLDRAPRNTCIVPNLDKFQLRAGQSKLHLKLLTNNFSDDPNFLAFLGRVEGARLIVYKLKQKDVQDKNGVSMTY